MNYRHAFHAGNFADLVKHAALLQVLARLTAGAPGPEADPLTVIDTHAGRGLYDLAGPEARKSGEAEAGIVRLMAALDAPAEFRPLTKVVAGLNSGVEVRRYPGSPWLIAEALRPGDNYLACELRPDEHGALRELMKGWRNVHTLCADGYDTAVAHAPKAGRLLVLIDPPFEQSDDYRRIVETIRDVRTPGATFLVWLPLKDLETFDAFLREVPDGTAGLIVEARMRPLSDPMKMNGCALALIPGPLDLEPALQAIGDWTVGTLGEGGLAKVYRL